MGLYDQYRQANSQAVSQFVGSALPEMVKVGDRVEKRYNEALDIDDKLTEALGNLQHLKDDADTQYANELKEKYMARLSERSTRADYENLGRRTRRDAMEFTREYTPLVQRQQAMAEIVKKVQEDKDLFNPQSKAEIIQWTKDSNAPKKNADGSYVRDSQGRIKLEAIQALPYAKDVNIVDKLEAKVKEIEIKVTQGPYVTKDGKLISEVKSVRTPENIARITKELIEADPEIKAMLDRDLMLKTYKLSASDFKTYGDSKERNVPLFEQLTKAGATATDIETAAKLQGMTVEQSKKRPIDIMKERAKANGKTEEDAYREFYMNDLKTSLMSPVMKALGSVYGRDSIKLDVTNDPNADASASEKAKAASEILLSNTTAFSVSDMYNKPTEKLAEDVKGMRANLNSALANINVLAAQALNVTPLKGSFSKEDRDRFLALTRDKSKLNDAVNALKKQGNDKAAAALEKQIADYQNASMMYEIAEHQLNHRKVNPGAKATSFTLMQDINNGGTINRITANLTDQANSLTLDGIDIATGKRYSALSEEEYGDVASRIKNKKFSSVEFTTSSIGGKPVVQITEPDGKLRAVVLDSIPPAQMSEIYASVVRSSAKASTSAQKTNLENTGFMGLGEQAIVGTTRTEIASWEPSTVPYPLGDGFKVKVVKEGSTKLYKLSYGSLEFPKYMSNPADILVEIGKAKYKEMMQ